MNAVGVGPRAPPAQGAPRPEMGIGGVMRP